MSRSQPERAAVPDDASPAFILISRVLIAIMALLLVIIPWSERYSSLDSFPQSHDTEFSVLTFFLILGLILLLIRAAQMQLRRLLVRISWLLSILPPALSLPSDRRHSVVFTDPHRPPLPVSSLTLCNLPLQI